MARERAVNRCWFSEQEHSFLAAIRDDPANDAPRLIYADWLDERNRGEYAEFIRLQCQNARGQTDWWKYDYSDREKILVKKHGFKWRGERATANGWMSSGLWFKTFHRGLPAVEAIYGSPHHALKEADKHLARVAPHFQLCVTISVNTTIMSDPVRLLSVLGNNITKRAQIVTIAAYAEGVQQIPLSESFVRAVISALADRKLACIRLWNGPAECKPIVEAQLGGRISVAFLSDG